MSRLALPALLLLLASITGCREPATFQIETVVHPDGSCTRSIWQPKDFLPDEAARSLDIAERKHDEQPDDVLLSDEEPTPSWNERWETISGALRPQGQPEPDAPIDRFPYIFARGTFKNPDDIPPHYRFVSQNHPQLGASEIQRRYRRIDYGFLVEHRWKEKITNIVTLHGYLQARDQLLDLLIPIGVEFIEEELGEAYDVSALVDYVRTEGRAFLEALCVAFYDAALAQDKEDDPWNGLADVTGRFGLELRDEKGKLFSDEQMQHRFDKFLRQLIIEHVRHHDGRRLTHEDVDAILENGPGDRPNDSDPSPWKERLEQSEDEIARLMMQMVGLYDPLQFLFQGKPRYEFTLRLPGQLLETNGRLDIPDRVSWSFTSSRLFPDGYAMRARSVELDLDTQQRVFGRSVIADGVKAAEFMELVGEEGPIFEAVRNAYDTADPGPLHSLQGDTAEQSRRIDKLRRMLLQD